MSLETFHISVNQGIYNAVTYTRGDNLEYIEITNSDDSYYQTGILSLYDVDDYHDIGETVNVYVEDDGTNYELFTGYIARRNVTGLGKKIYQYQLIGKTYDLWRYLIEDASMTGSTAYIASALTKTYGNGILGEHIDMTAGTDITDYINFENVTLGDALTTLIGIDGCKFYVDSDNELRYYKPTEREWGFSIEESDLIDMTPIEEADEDIINDCLVIGGTGYSNRIIQNTVTICEGIPQSIMITGGLYIAQRFKAKDDELNAIKLYLDRTEGDASPGDLNFWIFNSSDTSPIIDTFKYIDIASDPNLDNGTNKDLNIWYTDSAEGTSWTDGYLLLDSAWTKGGYFTSPEFYGDEQVGFGVVFCHSGLLQYSNVSYLPSTMLINKVGAKTLLYDLPTGIHNGYIWCYIGSGSVINTSNFLGSSLLYMTGDAGSQRTRTFYFTPDQEVILYSGQKFFIVFKGVDYNVYWEMDKRSASITNECEGIAWRTDDFITWDDRTYKAGSYYRYPISYITWDGITFKNSGSIQTKVINTPIQYVTVSTQNYCPTNMGRILISASNDNGANWVGVDDGLEYDFGTENSSLIIKYIISANKGGSYYNTNASGLSCPMILKTSITGYDSTKILNSPGSSLIYSNEIKFSPSDLPYPSGWTDWKTYTSPKLQLTTDKYYWIVLSGTNATPSSYWSLYYASGYRAYSDGCLKFSRKGLGQSYWSGGNAELGMYPSGDLCFELGFKDATSISQRAINQDSIDKYGRHFRKISDSNLTTNEAALSRAELEVSGMEMAPRKGSITIEGKPMIQTYYKFSSNLANLEIDDVWDVVSYTHRIDNNGFTTTVDYGKHAYDITKKITSLEAKVL